MRRLWLFLVGLAVGLVLISTAASRPRPAPPIARPNTQMLTITPPADVTAPVVAACGASYCAVVIYSYTVAGGFPPYDLVCNLASPAVLTMAHHTISCIGQDSEDDSTPASTFHVTVTPAVNSFSPASGGPETKVTIMGLGFQGVTAVDFGTTPASTYRVISATEIVAYPGETTMTGPISVVATGTDGSSVIGTRDVDFMRIPPPDISSFGPSPASVRSTVTVNGANFAGTTQVTLGGVNVAYRLVSPTKLTFTLPVGSTGGAVTVTATGGTGTSVGILDVLSPPAISSLTPSNGSIGSPVTIDGTDLQNTIAVRIGNILTVPTTASATQVTFVVPPGAVGAPVTVLASNGSATSAGTFTVTG